ncbi:hypothetical protein V8C43DRAFT_105089 [Trichoderma afarasin]
MSCSSPKALSTFYPWIPFCLAAVISTYGLRLVRLWPYSAPNWRLVLQTPGSWDGSQGANIRLGAGFAPSAHTQGGGKRKNKFSCASYLGPGEINLQARQEETIKRKDEKIVWLISHLVLPLPLIAAAFSFCGENSFRLFPSAG